MPEFFLFAAIPLFFFIIQPILDYRTAQQLQKRAKSQPQTLIEGITATITYKSGWRNAVSWLRADLILMDKTLICIHYHRFLGFKFYASSYLFSFSENEITVIGTWVNLIRTAQVTAKNNRMTVQCDVQLLLHKTTMTCCYLVPKKQNDIVLRLEEWGLVGNAVL